MKSQSTCDLMIMNVFLPTSCHFTRRIRIFRVEILEEGWKYSRMERFIKHMLQVVQKIQYHISMIFWESNCVFILGLDHSKKKLVPDCKIGYTRSDLSPHNRLISLKIYRQSNIFSNFERFFIMQSVCLHKDVMCQRKNV